MTRTPRRRLNIVLPGLMHRRLDLPLRQILCALTATLALLFGGGIVAPTAAQANTTVTCTGTETITAASWVVFDNAAQTCAITNTAPATVNGNMFFAAVPHDIFQPTAAFAVFVGGVAENFAFEFCDVGGLVVTNGNSCSNGFLGSNGVALTGAYEVIVGGTRYRMEVSFTVNDAAQTIDITSATVTIITTTGYSAADKAKIADYLLNTLNNFGGSIFDTDGESIFGNGAGPGASFAPNGLGYGAMRLRGDPDNPFDRTFGAVDYTPAALQGQDRADNSFNFRFDLTRMARAAANGDKVLGADKSVPQAASRSPFNFWISGRYVDFKDKRTTSDRDGHVWWVTGGLSYQITDSTKIGAFTRVKQGEVSSNALTANLDSDFWGGGAFIVQQLGYGARAMGAVHYEVGDNNIVIAGASGQFNSSRLSFEGRIDKRFHWGPHWIEPAVHVLYARESRDGYTDSAGTVVASSDWTLGRLSYGPKIGTTIGGFGGIKAIKPYVKVNGVWDFQRLGDATLTTGVVLLNASTALNLGAGTEIVFVNGMTLSAAGDWYGFNTELSAWSFTGSLGAPLSAFGILGFLPSGFVSLNMTAAEQNVGAKLKLTVMSGK